MAHFILWMVGVGLAIGLGPNLKSMTFDVAKSVARAFQQDQMSYSRFTKTLLGEKPEAPAKTP